MSAPKQAETGTSAIRLGERFDYSCFKNFKQEYESLLTKPDVKTIDLDFSRVSYIDSSALGMLLLLREKADENGKYVRLAGCRGLPLNILEMAHFRRRFTFV